MNVRVHINFWYSPLAIGYENELAIVRLNFLRYWKGKNLSRSTDRSGRNGINGKFITQ